MSAVEVRDLFRVFATPEGGVAALQGLTLHVEEGEICVVLGPSGSGKSTLLRVVAGLARPSAGSVTVAGHELGSLSARQLAAYRAEVLGYADQHYRRALAPELSARELIGLQLGLAGATTTARRLRADELLERVGLADRRDARPVELSGGEQQRVALCAALAHRPRLLLADEPTGELDRENARVIYALVAALAREQRCTVLVVSHDPDSTAIADRVVRVRDGRLAEETVAGADAVVIGRGGWVRLPEQLLRDAGIGALASVDARGGELVVRPLAGSSPEPPAEPAPPLPPAPDNPPLVAELRGVTRRYADVTPLHALDARFHGSRVHAVTGPSGSGKTTLLHLLAGLDLPTEGEVVVGGTIVSALGRSARAGLRRTEIGYIGQDAGLLPFLSARENIELGLELRGIEVGDRVVQALAAVGLTEHADRRVDELSAGQQGRVAVARALAARPALVLADEPTARLDAVSAAAVARLFVELARTTGTAFVCATHDPLVIESADEVLALGSS